MLPTLSKLSQEEVNVLDKKFLHLYSTTCEIPSLNAS